MTRRVKFRTNIRIILQLPNFTSTSTWWLTRSTLFTARGARWSSTAGPECQDRQLCASPTSWSTTACRWMTRSSTSERDVRSFIRTQGEVSPTPVSPLPPSVCRWKHFSPELVSRDLLKLYELSKLNSFEIQNLLSLVKKAFIQIGGTSAIYANAIIDIDIARLSQV